MMERYPHESRAASASASPSPGPGAEPKFMVLDEPTSALDMSIQAQIVKLLRDLQIRHGLAYLFISHDLKVVRAMAHDVAVMRRGRVVEQGPADAVFAHPQTPYTRALMGRRLRDEGRRHRCGEHLDPWRFSSTPPPTIRNAGGRRCFPL